MHHYRGAVRRKIIQPEIAPTASGILGAPSGREVQPVRGGELHLDVRDCTSKSAQTGNIADLVAAAVAPSPGRDRCHLFAAARLQ
jgi:hypothetical protein